MSNNNMNDDVASNSTDYLKRKVKREVKSKSYQAINGSANFLREKRKVRVHRKHINKAEKFDNNINIMNQNFNSNYFNSVKFNKLDNKIENNNYMVNNLNLSRNILLNKRQDMLNKNPTLRSSLNYMDNSNKKFDFSNQENNKYKNGKQKKYNRSKMKQNFTINKERDLDNDGVPDRIDIDDNRNAVQTVSDQFKVGNNTEKYQKNLEKQKIINENKMSKKYNFQDKESSFKFEEKNFSKENLKNKNPKKSIFGSLLTSRSIGERTKTQKVILTPTKIISSAGASLKESINEEIENSNMEGIQLANSMISPLARKLKFEGNSLIATRVGFDKKAFSLGKIEKKIMKADKKAFRIKKAQRKNIRKKAKINAKAYKGSKLDIVGRIKAFSSQSTKQIKNKIASAFASLIKTIKGTKFIASASGLLLVVIIMMLVLAPIMMLVSGIALTSASEQENGNLDFSTSGLSSDVMQWEDTVIKELNKHGLIKYKDLVLVIIHLESRGKGLDVMQSSENIGLAPNSIDDPKYSIEVGVNYLSKGIKSMKRNNVDVQTLIQGYNYGTAFIPYVAKRGGKWTQKLANDFSDLQAKKQGWSNFGDKKYVPKALEHLKISGDEIVFEGSFDLNGGKLAYPVPGYESSVSSSYGWRIHPIYGTRKFHTGTDIPATTGTPVIASADGKVIEAGWKGGYGNAVLIDHGSGIVTLYGHNSRLEVVAGQTVRAGQTIARVGSTGDSTGPHCHFEVRKNGEYTNPLGWLK